jgi:S1-C subfamily serine protease
MNASETPTLSTGTSPDATRSGRVASTARPLVVLAAASLLGGSAALAGAWAVGAFDDAAPAAEVTPIVNQQTGSSSTGSTGIDVADIYRRSGPGVVQITSTSNGSGGTDVFGNPVPGQAQQGLGSGFVIDKEGHIVTNYHVVEGASEIEVSFSNQDTVDATIVGTDPSTDLALLKVGVEPAALTPLSLADSDAVVVGDPVVAIGNPFALQREVRAPNSFTIDHVIQTDAPINSGNSGGPLIDSDGRVIGVNSQIAPAEGSSGNVGIGFAVPSNTVKTVVAQLLEDGRVDRAYLGVTLQEVDSEVAGVLRLPADKGVLIGNVQPGSPAAEAGLEGGTTQVVVAGESYQIGGDMVVAVDGKDVSTVDGLRDAIAAHKPGETVELTVVRSGGDRETIEVELGRVPERSSS